MVFWACLGVFYHHSNFVWEFGIILFYVSHLFKKFVTMLWKKSSRMTMLLLISEKYLFTFRCVSILEKFAVIFWINRKFQKKLSIQFGSCLEMAFGLTYGRNSEADLELNALLKCTVLLKEMLILVIIIITSCFLNKFMRDYLISESSANFPRAHILYFILHHV